MLTLRRLLGVAWVGLGFILLIEVFNHAMEGASDPRSQLFRILFVGIYIAAAVALCFRGRYSTVTAIAASVLAGVRSYYVLAMPRVVEWTYANRVSLTVVVLSALSILTVVVQRYMRSAQR